MEAENEWVTSTPPEPFSFARERYNLYMTFRITALDVKVAAAHHEFAMIADSDIQSALGHPSLWRTPSEAAMAVYDEVVRQAEAQAELESEQFGPT